MPHVTVSGVKGYEGRRFASVTEAYNEISPLVDAIAGLGSNGLPESSNDLIDAVFDHDANGNIAITWNVYGEQKAVDPYVLSFGRTFNRYNDKRNITSIKVVGMDENAAIYLRDAGGRFNLPQNEWGNATPNVSFSITGVTLNGITAAPSLAWCNTADPVDVEFKNCTINGALYNYYNRKVKLNIEGCTFNAPANTGYAITSQGDIASEGGTTFDDNGTVTVKNNKFFGYTRGVNFQRKLTTFVFEGNTIESTVSEPDRAAVQLTDGKAFVVKNNVIKVNGGNAFTFHSAGKNTATTYVFAGNNVDAPYIGYSDRKDTDVNERTLWYSDNVFNGTSLTECMKKDASAASESNLVIGAAIEGVGDGLCYKTLTAAAVAWRKANGIATEDPNFGGHPTELTAVDSINWKIFGKVDTGNGEGVSGSVKAPIISCGYIYPSVSIRAINVTGVDGEIVDSYSAGTATAFGGNPDATVAVRGLRFGSYLNFNSQTKNLVVENCSFADGIKVMQVTGDVTIGNCTFVNDGTRQFAIFVQSTGCETVNVIGNTISGSRRGINVHCGANTVSVIDGNSISGLTGEQDAHVYGSAIQVTASKSFRIVNNVISLDAPINAFHIHSACAEGTTVYFDGNDVNAKYLGWDESAGKAIITYGSGNVISATTDVAHCTTKTEEIASTFKITD